MRFVAGRGAVAELLLAWAPWRRAIGNQLLPRRRGEAVAGRKPLAQRTACRGIEAELHREELAAPQKTMWLHREELAAPRKTMRLHREANKRTQKEKGPEETLISLPSHFYLLPCERATRHATRPNRRSPLACSAGMHCRRSCRRHSSLAFTAGMQCWRSCRWHAVLAKLPLQLCRDCKEGCSKCKNCVELWEYGKDKGVTEYVLSV